MAVSYKTVTTQIGTTIQTFYTVPRNTTAIIVAGVLVNAGLASSDVDVYLVDKDDSAQQFNKVLSDKTLAVNDDYLLETVINQALSNEASLQCSATTNGDVNIRLTVKEIT